MDEESIFAAAIKLDDPARRKAYLDRVCGENAALRADVEELLQASSDAGSFLDRPLLEQQSTRAIDWKLKTTDNMSAQNLLPFLVPCNQPGRIGKLVGKAGEYEVIEVVGEGGMGIVLRAYDTKLS